MNIFWTGIRAGTKNSILALLSFTIGSPSVPCPVVASGDKKKKPLILGWREHSLEHPWAALFILSGQPQAGARHPHLTEYKKKEL